MSDFSHDRDRPADRLSNPSDRPADADDRHLDPITGEPGARPVGTGVGAATAGLIGTAVGAIVGGPVGAAVGSVVGAVGGGLLGKGIAETIDPTLEEAYWREQYRHRPYAEPGYSYDDYGPAYRTGYEGYSTYAAQGLSYDEAEPQLRDRYERQYPGHRLGWDRARYASQDAWTRAHQSISGYRNEEDYWRHNYAARPYREASFDYDDYGPAYRLGYDGYHTYYSQGMTFAEAEPLLQRDYERRYGDRRLGWEQAKAAVQDAWHRLENAARGDQLRRG